MGFPGGSDRKESAWNVGDLGLIPELGRSPGGGNGNLLQYSCLENPPGQRSLVGYSPWDLKELDMTATKHIAQPPTPKTWSLKLRNLALFSIWEDARIRTHWNNSFMHSAIWGQYPVFSYPEFPQGSSLGVAAVWRLLDGRYSLFLPWVPSELTSSP